MGPAEQADALLGELGIPHLRDSSVAELSYGTRRKVELARALALQPRMLLLDEPAAGLNGAERKELGSRLLHLRTQGMTIVLIEHQMDLVSATCDELTVLDFGQVICEGSVAHVTTDQRVVEAYLGVAGSRA